MTLVDILVAIVGVFALWSGLRQGKSLPGRIVGAVVSAALALVLVALVFYAYRLHGAQWWGSSAVRESVFFEPLSSAVETIWKKLF